MTTRSAWALLMATLNRFGLERKPRLWRTSDSTMTAADRTYNEKTEHKISNTLFSR